MTSRSYSEFFRSVAGNGDFDPYPFQERLAGGDEGRGCESLLIDVPTGLGKTAAVTMAWLWNRVMLGREDWPRRLVYCLPMRTLVEQTRDEVKKWLETAWQKYPSPELEWLKDNSPVVLMGGEGTDGDRAEWDLHPERPAILIGTQDMLLSRALNRGYGMSRFRWPMHFGLLNNDCLWVLDETQLMGVGLATSAQLHAFRERFGENGKSRTWWMSATLDPNWLATVDFAPAKLPSPESLKSKDLDNSKVSARWNAGKAIHSVPKSKASPDNLAGLVVERSTECEGDFVLVIVNTVNRSLELKIRIDKLIADRDDMEVILLHSRFRRQDREERIAELLGKQERLFRIVVSTQVIEVGVDISAKILFTDLAPWPSLIQRFGRCNRKGEMKSAEIHWVDLDESKEAAPYSEVALVNARKRLASLADASPRSLADHPVHRSDLDPVRHVIRERDLLGLFDTTPDLSGGDIDISHFIRDGDDLNVQVFWRDWEKPSGGISTPPLDTPAPHRDELCPVPVGQFKNFLSTGGKTKKYRNPFRWDQVDSVWVRVDKGAVYPGQTYVLHASSGGYRSDLGWTGGNDGDVPIMHDAATSLPEGDESDAWALADWRTIREHTDEVVEELEKIVVGENQLPPEFVETLRVAARWHDWGKVHPVFQAAIGDEIAGDARPAAYRESRCIGKAPGRDPANDQPSWWRRYERKHFRHELASALAMLQPSVNLGLQAPELRDLAAYLAAAHHGRIRLSIRSFPDEEPPPDSKQRFARGLRDRDKLPPVDLGGGGGVAPEVVLSLEPMEIGLGEFPPFVDLPSWTERTLSLRDRHGPFRLAYFETLLRAADMRGSALATTRIFGDLRKEDDDNRTDPTLEKSPGGGEETPPDGIDPEGGPPQHVDGAGASRSGLATGNSQPIDATRSIKTTEGVLTYSEVASRLAGRIVEVSISLQDGEYADEESWESLARNIHRDICSHLVPDWAGTYRDIDVRVGTHEPPEHWKVPVEMADYDQSVRARWQYLDAEDEYLLLETLAWIESRFLSIHPFKDFNGRVVRLLMTEVLRRAELPVADAAVETESERQTYFTALRAADRMDFSPMMEIWKARLEGAMS